MGAALVYRVSAIPARVRFGLINVEVGDGTAIYTDPELWPESSSSDPDCWPGSSYHCWFTHRGSIVDLAFRHLPSWVRPPSRWMRPAASYIWDRPAYLRAQGIDFIPRPGHPWAFGLPAAHQEVVDRGVELLDQASAWVR